MKMRPFAGAPHLMRRAGLFSALVAFTLLFMMCFSKRALALDVEAQFDLSVPVKQEQEFELNGGERAVLGIEPQIQLVQPLASLGNGYGSWKVYWYTGVLNTSYMIDVKNYSITNCYDNYTSGFGVVVDSSYLDWNSKWSSQTTRYHEDIFTTFDTRILTGTIQGTELITKIN